MSCQYLATGEYTCNQQVENPKPEAEKFTNTCTSCVNAPETTEHFTNNTNIEHIIYHSNGDIMTK